MIEGILLIVLSLLAVPSLLLSKRPDAKEILDKIAPYQGWVGVVFCTWGLLSITLLLIKMFTSLSFAWVLAMGVSVVTAALGFILGYNLINTYVLSKNEESKEKGAQLHAKLVSIQEKVGLVGVFLGTFFIAFKIVT